MSGGLTMDGAGVAAARRCWMSPVERAAGTGLPVRIDAGITFRSYAALWCPTLSCAWTQAGRRHRGQCEKMTTTRCTDGHPETRLGHAMAARYDRVQASAVNILALDYAAAGSIHARLMCADPGWLTVPSAGVSHRFDPVLFDSARMPSDCRQTLCVCIAMAPCRCCGGSNVLDAVFPDGMARC